MNYVCPICAYSWRQCTCRKGPYLDVPTPKFNTRAPAPKPDELTVDDVLAFAEEAVQIRDVWMNKCTIGRWGNDGAGAFGLWFPSEPDVPAPASDAPDFTGTLREVLTEAKRRGLLG